MRPRNGDRQTRSGVIVVGIDGSLHSVDVLREAARIAQATECSLESVTVWQPQEILLDYGEMERNPELDATQVLFDISKFAFGTDHPAWYTTHSVPGDPAQVLIDRSAKAEMLIVGTHGHSGLISSLMGSVSRACVDHAECLVLLVPTVWAHSRHELSVHDLVGATAGTPNQ